MSMHVIGRVSQVSLVKNGGPHLGETWNRQPEFPDRERSQEELADILHQPRCPNLGPSSTAAGGPNGTLPPAPHSHITL